MAKKIQITEPKGNKKHPVRSKTILISLVLVMLGALQTFDFAEVFPPEYAGLIIAAIGVIMAALRKMTKSAI